MPIFLITIAACIIVCAGIPYASGIMSSRDALIVASIIIGSGATAVFVVLSRRPAHTIPGQMNRRANAIVDNARQSRKFDSYGRHSDSSSDIVYIEPFTPPAPPARQDTAQHHEARDHTHFDPTSHDAVGYGDSGGDGD